MGRYRRVKVGYWLILVEIGYPKENVPIHNEIWSFSRTKFVHGKRFRTIADLSHAIVRMQGNQLLELVEVINLRESAQLRA